MSLTDSVTSFFSAPAPPSPISSATAAGSRPWAIAARSTRLETSGRLAGSKAMRRSESVTAFLISLAV
jgi:hypothetical protein